MRALLDRVMEDLYPIFQSEGIAFAIDGMTVHEIAAEFPMVTPAAPILTEGQSF